MAFSCRQNRPYSYCRKNWVLAASLSIQQSGKKPESGVRLKAYIDFMPRKTLRIFSHLINPSHCRYRLKLRQRSRTSILIELRFAIRAGIETRASLAIVIATPCVPACIGALITLDHILPRCALLCPAPLY